MIGVERWFGKGVKEHRFESVSGEGDWEGNERAIIVLKVSRVRGLGNKRTSVGLSVF